MSARREYDSFGIALQKLGTFCLGISLGATIEHYQNGVGFLFGKCASGIAIALIFLAFNRSKPLSDSKLGSGVS